MLLKRFTIINHNDSLQSDEETQILINMDQIVTVKPINISTETRDIIEGYWIRLSNGKKYRAIRVPDIIIKTLKEDLPAMQKSVEEEVSLH